MEAGIARSAGTCMTMGTASTMTTIAEALGLTLPGAASIPAGDSAHPRMASICGRRIVEMVWEDLKPRDILTAQIGRERAGRAQRDGRLDQRDDPSGRDGAPRRREDRPEGFRRIRRRRVPVIAQPAAVRRVADGGFPHAGGIRALFLAVSNPAASRCRDRVGQDDRRGHRRRPGLQRRRDPAAEQSDRSLGRHRDPLRQPRARRLRDQAAGGRSAAAQAYRAGDRVRQLRRDERRR